MVVDFYTRRGETSASCNSSEGATHLAGTKLSKDLPCVLLKNRLLTGVRYAAAEDRDLSVHPFFHSRCIQLLAAKKSFDLFISHPIVARELHVNLTFNRN